MGAWDASSFGNDTACDWVGDFEDNPGLDLVRKAIEAVPQESYVDADVACHAIAACEVIARLLGRWGERNAYSEAIDAWVDAHPDIKPPPTLVKRAVEVLDRISSDADSELAELWEGDEEWLAAMSDLRSRVADGPPPSRS